MRELCTMTDKEAMIIGNVAFRKWKTKELYQSKNWKLHLFEDANCVKVYIVDEGKPLMNIDDLYDKDDRWTHCSSDPTFIPQKQYNWIQINKDLVVEHYMKFEISESKMLILNSQYHIFMHLENMGFMGIRAQF